MFWLYLGCLCVGAVGIYREGTVHGRRRERVDNSGNIAGAFYDGFAHALEKPICQPCLEKVTHGQAPKEEEAQEDPAPDQDRAVSQEKEERQEEEA